MMNVHFYDILCWLRLLVKYFIFNIFYSSVQIRLRWQSDRQARANGVVVNKSGHMIKIGYKSFV